MPTVGNENLKCCYGNPDFEGPCTSYTGLSVAQQYTTEYIAAGLSLKESPVHISMYIDESRLLYSTE
jgi:hypothetical protein